MNMLAAAALGLLAGLVASAPAAAADCDAGQDRPSSDVADCGHAGQQLIPIDDDLDARQLFERIDRNGDGQITPEEWAVWYDTEFAAAAASAQGSSRAAN
jgi:hypothetical protein